MHANKQTHTHICTVLTLASTHTYKLANNQQTHSLTNTHTHTHTKTHLHKIIQPCLTHTHTRRTAAAEMENVKLPAAVMKSAKKVFPRGRGLTQQHVAQPHLYVLEACLKSLITKGFKCERQVCGNFWYSMLLTLFCLQGAV